MIIPIINKSTTTEIHFKVFNSIENVNSKHWNEVVGDKNIYASLPYLSAMEKSLGDELGFRYLLFYNQDSIPVAVSVVECLNFIDKGLSDKQEVCRIRNTIKRRLLTTKGIRLMTCGTPFASGENGFVFSDKISSDVAYEHLAKALIELQKIEKKTASTPVILFKELFPNSFESGKALSNKGFSEFQIEVNMIMQISPTWKNLNDYLNAMVTKFRTKAKTALRKSENLLIIDMNLNEIEFHKDKLHSLYIQVLNKSSVQFGALNKESFVHLKRNLREDFIIKGYFLGMELVGFSSSFIFNSILDANYVGINYELNQEYAIYQRMLYDYIELAITRNCSELRFGRTAEEIKSSVGATPVPMKLFIRHRNLIANRILRAIVGTIKPSEYELRKPFKQIESNEAK
jgi:uncharacterized protein (UPF0332 family)